MRVNRGCLARMLKSRSSARFAESFSPLLNRQVLFKLVMFSLLMAIVPVATYFGTLQLVWEGESPTTHASSYLSLKYPHDAV